MGGPLLSFSNRWRCPKHYQFKRILHQRCGLSTPCRWFPPYCRLPSRPTGE